MKILSYWSYVFDHMSLTHHMAHYQESWGLTLSDFFFFFPSVSNFFSSLSQAGPSLCSLCAFLQHHPTCSGHSAAWPRLNHKQVSDIHCGCTGELRLQLTNPTHIFTLSQKLHIKSKSHCCMRSQDIKWHLLAPFFHKQVTRGKTPFCKSRNHK